LAFALARPAAIDFFADPLVFARRFVATFLGDLFTFDRRAATAFFDFLAMGFPPC
jgi:hypothetical protein